jgi:hypothetical protein
MVSVANTVNLSAIHSISTIVSSPDELCTQERMKKFFSPSLPLERRFINKNLTPQPPSHLSLALPYKGREKEKLLFLEGGERIPLPASGRGSSRITESDILLNKA